MRKLIWPVIILILLATGGFWWIAFAPNTGFEDDSVIFYIPTGESFDQTMERIQHENLCSSFQRFQLTAKMKRCSRFKAGRYRLTKNSSSHDLINQLRSGDQEAVRIRLDHIQTLDELCGLLGRELERDSIEFANVFFNPEIQQKQGFNDMTMTAMFLADTYDFFWTTTPDAFLSKMKDKYDIFWDENRLQRAAQLDMSPVEVVTLASIVKGETASKEEAPIVAGLYINRLQSGMRLQSDPTVLFAGNLQGIQRVLHSDLNIDSPYNTYKYSGLPPGPIWITEGWYTDAVLNYSRHSYIYMCAKPGGAGLHNFSETYDQHLVYAEEYRRWLDQRGTTR